MPESGVAGQCEMPPVPTQRDALGLRVARAAQRAAELVRARSGVSGGPWQLTLTGITGKS